MEPMYLKPAGKNYIWGGSKLNAEYNKNINMYPLAETWECSIHPDGPSTIIGGEFSGETLDKVLAIHPEFLGTRVEHSNGLPILIKFIDAAEDLSVQVHPGDEYARIHENQDGKTEMYYVLDAAPNAHLVYGFAHDVTAEQLRSSIKTGQLMKHLQKVPIQKDDVFFVPSGTVHAIGAGSLIAEIQQNSNVTYRIYDYGRVDESGNKRELHFQKAVQVMDMKASKGVHRQQRMIHYYPGCASEILCRCKYFETERILISKCYSFTVTDRSFQVLLCLEGRGKVIVNSASEQTIQKGDCYFIPADCGDCIMIGNMTVLKIRC